MDAAIDIHTHVVPFDFPAYPGGSAGHKWPHMAEGADCNHRSVLIDNKVFRTVAAEAWDVGRRIEQMTAAGVTRQVLSPMPELLSYWLPAEDAAALCAHVNDTLAAMVAQAPDRFAALGGVPLQDVDRAIRELERIMALGAFRGVEIGTNIDGVAIGDPRFEPFYAAAETLGAAIFVHPLHPAGLDRLVGPPGLEQLVAFPGETSLAVASLITGGVLERHPGLRIAISHGGGGFALTLPRLAFGWSRLGVEADARGPVEQARSLFYDTLVYDPATLAHLISTFGRTQLCLGTDFPFVIQERAPLDRVEALAPDAELRALLLSGNARRFLGDEDGPPMRFLNEAWYCAAWGEEVTRTPLARRLLDIPVTLFRKADGGVVALADRCAHRFAPLSRGQVIGDTLQCPYHGLVFDGLGVCVVNPHGDGAIPRGARVRAFPVVERQHAIWIWMGDPSRANPDAIVDLQLIGGEAAPFLSGYIHMAANYLLVTDNLLDLTHAPYLHGAAIAPQTASREANFETGEDWVAATYLSRAATTPGLQRALFDEEVGDHHTRMDWRAPGVLRQFLAMTRVGEPAEAGAVSTNVHLLTPETEESTHYFWGTARNRRAGDPAVDERLRAMVTNAFVHEDEPMVAACRANMDSVDLMALKPVVLQTDVAAIRARRILKRLIGEQSAAAAEAALTL